MCQPSPGASSSRSCRGHPGSTGRPRGPVEPDDDRGARRTRPPWYTRSVPGDSEVTPLYEARLLDMLEAREDPLLCWGIVDGGFSDDELDRLIENALDEAKSLDDVDD